MSVFLLAHAHVLQLCLKSHGLKPRYHFAKEVPSSASPRGCMTALELNKFHPITQPQFVLDCFGPCITSLQMAMLKVWNVGPTISKKTIIV